MSRSSWSQASLLDGGARPVPPRPTTQNRALSFARSSSLLGHIPVAGRSDEDPSTSLDTGILEGVTRGLVLFLAKKEHIQTKEAMLKPKDLYDADECFITNSTVEIMPVTIVDGKKIGEGVPGPVTRALMIAYTSEVMRHV